MRQDGSTFPIEMSIKTIQLGDKRKFVAIVHDITERKEAEQALLSHQQNLEAIVDSRTTLLRESEARTRTVLTTMLDGVVHIDDDCIMLSVNNAIPAMFGYEMNELVGRKVNMLMPEPHSSAHDGYLSRYLQTRQPCTIGRRSEMEGRRKDGSLFPIELAINELADDKGSSFIGLIRDMSAQKAAEQHLQDALLQAQIATQVKGAFLANMSHEIRTPLNAVLGLAQIGMRDSAGSPAGKNFGGIARAGEHLLGVINDILDAAKIEAGKLEVEAHPFALLGTLDGVVSFVAGLAEGKGLDLSISLAPELPAWVLGDSLRLAQVLTNLLSNAIKFTATGEVTLRVARDGDLTYFRVIDTGIGMSEEQLARLFRPFEQADSSTTRSYGGTGLGLTISLDLARLMGGDLTVESRPDCGSSFLLQLPLPAVTAPETVAGPLPLIGQGLAGLRLLAADDVEANRLVLEDMLVHEGARVVFAENGQQALDRLDQAGVTAFDVVLMDVQMPVMDGYEATRRIRLLAPALPVLGLTAYALTEERQKCQAAGMVDVVTKPIDIKVLVAAIRRLVPASEAAVLVPVGDALAVSNFMSTPHSEGAIDWPALFARFTGRRDFIMKLTRSVHKHYLEAPARLRAAAELGDRAALTSMAHSVKGMSGSLEARRLYELAKDLEDSLRAGEERLPEQVEALACTAEVFLSELAHFDQSEG